MGFSSPQQAAADKARRDAAAAAASRMPRKLSPAEENFQYLNGRPPTPEESAALAQDNTQVANNTPGTLNYAHSIDPVTGQTRQDGFMAGGNGEIKNPFALDPIDPNAPGASLDTTQSDQDRASLSPLIQQLQLQAQTGDGAWQQQLANSTGQNNNAAMALGQSQPGVNRMASQMGAINAVGGNNQRAVGEGNVLRAQTQNAATNQLGSLYGAQGSLDANVAEQRAAASQGLRTANRGIEEHNSQTTANVLGGAASGIPFAGPGASALIKAGASDGGKVPGRPEVFGDNSKNDTVPAWLSPGEIVLPRSVTQSANAPEAASAFVQALRARHSGGNHFDDGGVIPPDSSVQGDGIKHGIAGVGYRTQQAASIANGGRFNTGDYNANRSGNLANTVALDSTARGLGPSVAPQQSQNSTDSMLANALAQRAGARGMGAGAAAMNGLATGAIGGQMQAGNVAGTAQGEQQAGQEGFAKSLLQQRQQDAAIAEAAQQAAWRNTLMNSGVSQADQKTMFSLASGAGQGVASLVDLLKSDKFGGFGGKNSDTSGADKLNDAFKSVGRNPEDDTGGGSAEGDYPDQLLSDDSPQAAAHGGLIHALRNGYADGGKVRAKFSDLPGAKSVWAHALPASAMSIGPITDIKREEDMLPPAKEQSFLDALRSEWSSAKYHQHNGQPSPLGMATDAVDGAKSKFLQALSLADDRPSPAVTAAPLPDVGVEIGKIRNIKRMDPGLDGPYRPDGLHVGIGQISEPQRLAQGGAVPDPGQAYYEQISSEGGWNPDAPQGPPGFSPGPTAVQPYAADTTGLGDLLDAGATPLGGEGGAPTNGPGPSDNPLNPAGNALQRYGERLKLAIDSPGAQTAPPPVAAAPKPAPAASMPIDRSPGEMAKYADEERSAIKAGGEAKSEEARQTAAALAEGQKVLQQSQLDDKAARDRAALSSQEAMGRVQQARDAMANIDTSVDPGRYWASRSMGGKIAGIIGLALGAIGAGNDGINRAAGMMTQAIDRDIDAQKAEHEFKLKKGQAGLDAAQSMYSMSRAATQDDLAATAAAKASAWGLVENKLKMVAAQAGDPAAKAQAMQLMAQVGMKKAEFDGQASSRLADAAYKQNMLQLERDKVGVAIATAGAKANALPAGGGLEALARYDKLWKEGGGWQGKLSKHIPGTAANDLDNVRTSTATAIATQINGGKAPRPALIELVKEQMLGVPGEATNDGSQKHAELRNVLLGMKGVAPDTAMEAE